MPGFFAFMGRFPLGGGFILRVRSGLLLRVIPTRVDVSNKCAYWSPKTIRLVSAGEAKCRVEYIILPTFPALLAHSGHPTLDP